MIAKVASVTYSELKRLNPELRRDVTPLGYKDYRLKLPVGKRGDGSHRLIEAQALVEMDEDTFRGLGAGAVDGAEAVLIAAARGVDEIARRSPISSAGKPAMKARIPRGRKAA